MNNRPINLPTEVWIKTLSFVNEASLLSFGTTCSFWSQTTDGPALWKQILSKKLGIQYSDLSLNDIQHPAKSLVINLSHLKELMRSPKEIYRNISSFFNKNAKDQLMIACIDDNVEDFIKIATSREEVNLNAWLDFACAYGAKPLVQHLLINTQCRRPDELMLKLAAGSGNQSMVEYLLSVENSLKINEIILDYGKYSHNSELISFLNAKIGRSDLAASACLRL